MKILNTDPLFNCYPDAYIQMHFINRGSYTSADVLSNLLNKLGKSDKMQGLPSILLFFCNIVNNTGARMLDSIYHMTLKLLRNSIFGVKHHDFALFYTLKWTLLRNFTKTVNH